jgi:integrase
MNDLITGYVTYLRAAGRPEDTTIRGRRYILQRLDRELPYGLDEVGTDDLEEWLAEFTGWTLYTYAQTIRDFCGWAAARSGQPDPAAALARIKTPDGEPRPASDDELAQALAELTGVSLTAVILAAFNSLRAAEVARLCREHVNRDQLLCRRKGVKRQTLPTSDVVWEHLAALPMGPAVTTANGQILHPVVTAARGDRFRPNYLSAWVSADLGRIGLPDLTLHRFRATFATRLAAAGKPATVIQDLMGHKHLNTTQKYIVVSDGQRRDAIATLSVPASHHQEAA